MRHALRFCASKYVLRVVFTKRQLIAIVTRARIRDNFRRELAPLLSAQAKEGMSGFPHAEARGLAWMRTVAPTLNARSAFRMGHPACEIFGATVERLWAEYPEFAILMMSRKGVALPGVWLLREK